ncbi:hypothetical protein Q8A73_004535 [Channa argus]|nr:hypothetical protein Q8A73_004535 [Channa argus]
MRRILRRVGKSQAPLQSTEGQLFPVPLQASGLEHAVKATSITSSMLHHDSSLALGGISTAAPDTEQISACTPHCWDPVDMFLHWSGEYLMSIVESTIPAGHEARSYCIRQGKRLSRNSPPLLITPLVFTLSSKSKPLSSSPPADWQEVSIRLIPSSPRRDLLSTSNMDSLHTEGKAVACRGQEESLNPELTSSTVGGDVTVVVWAS